MLSYLQTAVSEMEAKSEFKDKSEIITVKSRFGEISIDLSKAIYFPKGIYGFPEDLHFSLQNFPKISKDFEVFKFLQCLNDHSISLPVLPVGYDNNFIKKEDMDECQKITEVKKENFLMLLILTSQKQDEGFFRLFINTKAPIVVDTSLQMAVQHIFTNNKYAYREPLDSIKFGG